MRHGTEPPRAFAMVRRHAFMNNTDGDGICPIPCLTRRGNFVVFVTFRFAAVLRTGRGLDRLVSERAYHVPSEIALRRGSRRASNDRIGFVNQLKTAMGMSANTLL